MEIIKIGRFTESEIEALRAAGTILGTFAKALEAKEIDKLDEESKQLLGALAAVLNRLQ